MDERHGKAIRVQADMGAGISPQASATSLVSGIGLGGCAPHVTAGLARISRARRQVVARRISPGGTDG